MRGAGDGDGATTGSPGAGGGAELMTPPAGTGVPASPTGWACAQTREVINKIPTTATAFLRMPIASFFQCPLGRFWAANAAFSRP